MGVNSLPKTVTRQRRDCDLNPGPSAPESSTLTTRLPSANMTLSKNRKYITYRNAVGGRPSHDRWYSAQNGEDWSRSSGDMLPLPTDASTQTYLHITKLCWQLTSKELLKTYNNSDLSLLLFLPQNWPLCRCVSQGRTFCLFYSYFVSIKKHDSKQNWQMRCMPWRDVPEVPRTTCIVGLRDGGRLENKHMRLCSAS